MIFGSVKRRRKKRTTTTNSEGRKEEGRRKKEMGNNTGHDVGYIDVLTTVPLVFFPSLITKGALRVP